MPSTLAAPAPSSVLQDRFGRIHDDLRVSVTDRCNIRCFYCMPEATPAFMPRAEILTFEEMARVVRIAAEAGVKKLRITGGEPLLRKNLDQLVGRLAATPGITDVALTTNAVLLGQQAEALYDAGLRRLNIHLDTLDRARFQQLTRRDELPRVLSSIERALALGFESIKINAVATKGVSEQDIVPLARYGLEHGIEVRFIEFMPLDAQGIWDRGKVLLQDDMMAILENEFGPLQVVPDRDPRAPATEYRFADGRGRVGFISSVSRPFCLNCNRLRLTADGKLRYCLFAVEEIDVRDLLRSGAHDDEVLDRLRHTVEQKWAGHQIHSGQFIPPPRPMYAIGG